MLFRSRDLLALGMEPGPMVGRVLERLEDAQLEGALHSREEALTWVEQRYRTSISPRR